MVRLSPDGGDPLPHRLSVEEARHVELSLNPIRRLGQLAQYGERFGSRQVGWSPLPAYPTRGSLVRMAERFELADQEALNRIKDEPN